MGNFRLALKLLGSSVFAQIVVLSATAWCASKTGPGEFANYGLASSIAFALSSFNTLAAETRIAVVTDQLAETLFRVARSFLVSISGVLALLGGAIALFLDGALGAVIGFSAAAGFALGRQQLIVSWALRAERQDVLAINRLTQGFANAILIVLLALAMGPGFLSLILAWVISLELGNLQMRRSLGSRTYRYVHVNGNDWRALKHEVGAQPLSNLLASTVGSYPMFVLPLVGATEAAGAWALVNRVLVPFVNTTTNTLQPLYYGRAAALLRKNSLKRFRSSQRDWMNRLLASSIVVAIGCVVIIAVLLPLLGPAWNISRTMALPGTIFFVGLFAGLPMSQTLVLLGRVDVQFRWTVVRSVVCAIPFLFAQTEPEGSILGWSILCTLAWGVHFFLQRLELSRQGRSGE